MIKTNALLTVLVYSFLAASCAGHNDNTPPAQTPKQLLQSDLEAMKSMDFQNVSIAGENVDNFTLVFGGHSTAALQRYLNERLHYFFSADELKTATLTPSSFVHTGWSTDPDEDKKMKSAGAQVGAANIGMELWFQGALDGVTPIVTVGEKQIDLNSPRTGIMEIGDGYQSSVTISSGQVIPLPVEYRVAILMHEARHSDCTGGVTQAQLQIARDASSAKDFSDHYKVRSCGHMHVLCPEGHELAGLAACDDEPWGAYTVGAIFDREAAAQLTGVNQRIMEAMAADSLSRVLIDTSGMLNGRLGQPDMSSSEIQK